MSVELYKESPGKFDSRTLNRKILNRWTGRMARRDSLAPKRGTGKGGRHKRLPFKSLKGDLNR